MRHKKYDIVEVPSGKIGIVEAVGSNTVWVDAGGELKSFYPHELKKPKTVKSFDGETDVIIKAHQECLREYPMNLRAMIDDYGTPAITGAVHATNKCGCEIIGNGTLQFPLTIKFCNKHKH